MWSCGGEKGNAVSVMLDDIFHEMWYLGQCLVAMAVTVRGWEANKKVVNLKSATNFRPLDIKSPLHTLALLRPWYCTCKSAHRVRRM